MIFSTHCKALQKIQLSPGSNSQKYADRIDRKVSRLSNLSKSREYKKRRRERKEQRTSKTKQLEHREGKQYESGLMGFRNESPDAAQGEIPPPMTLSESRKVLSAEELKRVVIDLETSSRAIINVLNLQIYKTIA